MLVYIHNKKHRNIVESSIISFYNAIKQNPNFLKLISLFKIFLNPLFEIV